jgi:endonuclease YncB( thermonuclease family)
MHGLAQYKSLAFIAGLFALQAMPTMVVADDCAPRKISQTPKVEIVYDGNSFLVKNDYVSLTGVYVPSYGETGSKPEPLGKLAAEMVGGLIKNNKGIIGLDLDQLQSRKGNVLSHVYLANGKNLAQLMLENGLALVNTELPNVLHLKCYRDAEAKGRREKKGLWQFADKNVPIVPSNALTGDHKGFRIVRGKILSTQQGEKYFFLLMDTVAIRIANEEMNLFNVRDLAGLQGKVIELRGMLTFFKGKMFMQIHHPGQIDLLADKFLPVAKPIK